MKNNKESVPVTKEGTLRVWHIPNPPREPFHVLVRDIDHAHDVLNVLGDYDNYLGDEHIFSNACGLEVFEGGEWIEWHDENDNDIMEIRQNTN
jgi:hypothetical protein